MNAFEEWQTQFPEAAEALSKLDVLPPAPVVDDTKSEGWVQSLIRLEAPKLGCTLMRNNSGAFIDKTGRLVRVGLGNESEELNKIWKSSDLIGLAPDGRFLAVEVKKPGWTKPTNARERAQASFLNTVRSKGGIGLFCSDVNHLRLGLQGTVVS